MRIDDVKQKGIFLVNKKLSHLGVEVVDYHSHGRDDVVIVIMKDTEKREISISKEDMPHHSAIISFMHYTDTTAKRIEEKL